MSDKKVVVLKFGGSILQSEEDSRRVCAEIKRYTDAHHNVVAVVSAHKGETDRLVELGRSTCPSPDPHSHAELLATGEMKSASLLALRLGDAGISASVIDYRRLAIRTVGDALDSEPVALGFNEWDAVFADHSVAVIPGFVGINLTNRTTLLGRGGSDLTAIFVAASLNAQQCKLYKDVGGWYDTDPNRSAGARLYRALSWHDALSAGCEVVQPKAIRIASAMQQRFVVAGMDGCSETVVGERFSRLEDSVSRSPGSAGGTSLEAA